MKRWGLIVATFMLIISAAGCSLFPTGESYSWGDKEAEVTVGEDGATGKLNDSIAIDAKIEEPDNIQWKEYNVSLLKYTSEEVKTIADRLCQNKKIIDVNSYKEGYFNYEYSDGSSMTFNSQDTGEFTFIYNTKQNINKEYGTLVQNKNGQVMSQAELDELFPNDVVDGLAKDEAISQAKDMCNKMNISINDTPVLCVAMDLEHVDKLIEDSPYKGKDKYGNDIQWDKKDEVYYMAFSQNIDGIMINGSEKTANFYEICSPTVTVIVGKNGVLNVENHGLYNINSSTDVSVIDSEKAINILATDSVYAAIGNMTLTDMSLKYTVYHDLKTNEISIKPMWVYTLERRTTMEKDGQTYTSINRQTNFIDAVTGKVLGG